MSDGCDRELTAFERETIPYCRSLTVADLRAWAARPRRGGALRRQRGTVLHAHGGPRALLDYQREVCSLAESLLSSASGLLSLPTGGGKTFAALHVVLRLLTRGFRRVVWLAPQRVLLEQTRAELERVWWSTAMVCDLEVVSGDAIPPVSECAEASLVLATLQRGLGWDWEDWDAYAPELVVVDECHYLEANQFGALARRLKARGARLLGLSATPGRVSAAEMPHLLELFDGNLVRPSCLGEQPVAALVERGVYARVQQRRLTPTFMLDTERIATRRGYGEALLRAFSRSPGRLDSVVNSLVGEFREKSSLVFCHTVAHAQVVAAALAGKGVEVEVLASKFGAAHNAMCIEAFRGGRLRVLTNAKYAAVGTDLPAAEVALVTVPVGSPITYEQVVGRIARGPAVGGTVNAVLAEFDDNNRAHDGMKGYARFRHWWDAVRTS